VARFGLFLRQLFQPAASASSSWPSLGFGTALIVLGIVVNLSSAWHQARSVRALDKGEPPRSSPLALNVAIALLLAFGGVAMAISLVSVRGFSRVHSENVEGKSMAQATKKGIIDKPGNHSVDQTVDRLKNILQSKGITLFGVVDHSGEADK
jgi:putative membrane protein